jgi:hypothetical protein
MKSNAETSASNLDFKKIYDSQMAFRYDGKPLVPGRGMLLRNLHDPHPPKGGGRAIGNPDFLPGHWQGGHALPNLAQPVCVDPRTTEQETPARAA